MTIPQLALMHYYKGASLTRDTAKAIAVSNGHTSGDKLYNKWCYYCHKRNRLGIEETEVTNRNKLKMFEAVASVLEGPAKLKALEELKALKEKVANRFPNL